MKLPIKYRWISDKGSNSYEACAKHHNEVFDSIDDIHELPVHPNCKCKVEPFIYNWDDIKSTSKSMLNDMVEMGKTLVDDMRLLQRNFSSLEAKDIADETLMVLHALYIFIDEWDNMDDANTKGADKYFHAKANLRAAQLGPHGGMVAKDLSDFREWYQQLDNLVRKGMTLESSLKDIKEDQDANKYGRQLGRENPDGDPKKLLKSLRVRGLSDKY